MTPPEGFYDAVFKWLSRHSPWVAATEVVRADGSEQGVWVTDPDDIGSLWRAVLGPEIPVVPARHA